MATPTRSTKPQLANAGYLPTGMPQPMPEPDGLDRPYWQATRANRLLVQRCRACRTWLWGPEWICHACHALDPSWEEVAPAGLIHSWTWVWHPTNACLAGFGPYLAVLIELPAAGGIRMLGNLLGDPRQPVVIGAPVRAAFEPHDAAPEPYTLVQWRLAAAREAAE